MRSQTKSVSDLLRYEATKRPVLRDLLDRIAVITDAEIDTCPGLPWVRKELRRQRSLLARRAETDAAQSSTAILVEAAVVEGFLPDPAGEMRRWQAQEQFLALDRGSMLITPGKLLFLPYTGGFWFQTVFVHRLTAHVLSSTVSEGPVTKTEYAIRFQSEINGQYQAASLPTIGDPLPVETPAGISANVLGQYGVRFSR